MRNKKPLPKKADLYEDGGLYAQNGMGFNARDPYFDNPPIDPALDLIKSAGSAYLGNRMSSQAYFDWLYPDDKEKAKKLSQRSAAISGAVGGVSAALTQYGESQDYKRNAKWIADRQADQYYRVPYDRYSYNENLSNPYNQTAYKKGGKIRSWQEGGEVFDDEFEPDTEPVNEQVVFDSTQQGESNYSDFDTYDSYEGFEDPLPLSPDGDFDLSKMTPTLGNTPHRMNITGGDVSSTVAEIAQHESGGDYGIVNRSGGAAAINATGKYQFVPKYWHKEIAEFQGTTGKSQEETMEAFRTNPKVQDAFMNHVVNKYYLPEVKSLLPMAKQYGIDQGGLIKMLHYRGIEDTRRRLRTGDFTVSQKEKKLYNNPDILDYVRGK